MELQGAYMLPYEITKVMKCTKSVLKHRPLTKHTPIFQRDFHARDRYDELLYIAITKRNDDFLRRKEIGIAKNDPATSSRLPPIYTAAAKPENWKQKQKNFLWWQKATLPPFRLPCYLLKLYYSCYFVVIDKINQFLSRLRAGSKTGFTPLFWVTWHSEGGQGGLGPSEFWNLIFSY